MFIQDGAASVLSAQPLPPEMAFLERHGVLTRGALATERVTGGFAGIYRVLRAMEDSGRARRGYVVEGLGAAQFAVPGAIDRLRALSRPDGAPTGIGEKIVEVQLSDEAKQNLQVSVDAVKELLDACKQIDGSLAQ